MMNRREADPEFFVIMFMAVIFLGAFIFFLDQAGSVTADLISGERDNHQVERLSE